MSQAVALEPEDLHLALDAGVGVVVTVVGQGVPVVRREGDDPQDGSTLMLSPGCSPSAVYTHTLPPTIRARPGPPSIMISFLAGLFVGAGKFEEIKDNLDLERWFRLPKSHERRIHGHRHAGVRIVQDGPTLVLALDAHIAHPGLFTAEELLPYRTAQEPPCQREALNRRKVMRKARSKKKRPILLAELERRYRETPNF